MCLPDRSLGAACDKSERQSPNWVSDLYQCWIQHLIFESIIFSELPPRPSRAFFGRNDLVDQIIELVQDLTPLALIGPGGIGKTSIALNVLHSHCIKQRFGDDRRFIRCDRFPASLSHFLNRLSTVTGAGIENPADLTALQPFLSSKEILIVLDNAESILDPRGADAREIYAVVEELSRFDNICLCITSRISTIPPDCETLDIPALSMEAARNAFYRIYKTGEQSDAIDKILKQLDYHPLSVTLLATVAHQNRWDTSRLTEEWKSRRTGVLRTDHEESLAAAIELSLASPMFQELGPDARSLLGVVAFFPQGVDESNLDWLFPTIPDRKNIFDKFCVLSLTYRSNGFATMLAPLRDHLCPKDPTASLLLCTVKEYYSSRLSVHAHLDIPDFEETRWITSEDVNVEHLLDVFTSIDPNSDGVWVACAAFLGHLRWHRPRLTILGSKIQRLRNNHPSKSLCMSLLALAFDSLGNYSESRRLLADSLRLWRDRGNDRMVARTLVLLAQVNVQQSKFTAEGIPQAEGALEIYENLNDTVGQGDSLRVLAVLLSKDNQFDAAEKAASRAINLCSESDKDGLCQHHEIIGHIYSARGDTEAAVSHLKTALGIATSASSREIQASILRGLVQVLLQGGRFDDAETYLERLKLDGVDNLFSLGLAAAIQVCVWRRQGRFEEAESEVSRVFGLYEEAGAPAEFLEFCKGFLREVEGEANNPAGSG